MKFTPGQPVIVLNTEYKPAGAGIIKIFNPNKGQYTVDFKYANSEEPEEINIPEERLILKHYPNILLRFYR